MPWRFWDPNRRGTRVKAQGKNSNEPGSLNAATIENVGESTSTVTVSRTRLPFLATRKAGKGTKTQPSEREIGPTGLHMVHASQDPQVDLIFVHGLRGGSVKTWQKSGDKSRFWPKEWLPTEPGFATVNIHSFGYDSDWTSQKSNILNIHDFGKTLFEEMRNSEHLRTDESRPIIMLGHSMGGLVIKKAFILAQETEEWKDRIQRVFFLATPHRGSNYAAILSNILSISGVLTTRHYIDELAKSSATLNQINTSFRQCAQSITIFSFYETIRTKIGFSSLLIVEKDSAVLGDGFPDERVQYTNASHCDISKYYEPADPTYISIRNGLSSAVQDLLDYVADRDKAVLENEKELLRSYFNIDRSLLPEDYCDVADGSCRWLERRKDFQEWITPEQEVKMNDQKESSSPKIAIYWLQGRPGAGKTFVAAHVQNILRAKKCHLAYYQFSAESRQEQGLNACLKSLAYQMALCDVSIWRKLCDLTQSSPELNLDNISLTWTTLFEKEIFQYNTQKPFYWVIDALDQCSNWQDLLTHLEQVSVSFPLHIFVTTREACSNSKWQEKIYSLGLLKLVSMPYADIVGDIELYVKTRMHKLDIVETASMDRLTQELVSKSNGCFAWVASVLSALERTHTQGERAAVLESLPTGLGAYYEQCLRPVAENTLEIVTSKSALCWIVAAKKTLSAKQLSQAVGHDIGVTLLDSTDALEGICGPLVAIHVATQTLELIHPTVRSFFLSSAGELNVDFHLTNERIALILLQLLSSQELKPPRSARFLEKPRPELSPLLNYAIEYFSDHIKDSKSEKFAILSALDGFLRSKCLCWIERVSMSGSLSTLLRTSQNLTDYIQKMHTNEPSFAELKDNIRLWAMDIYRLATQFAEPLLSQPASIYYSISALCPSNSTTFQQYGQMLDFPTVEGERRYEWDDCIAEFSLGEETPSSISCRAMTIAVGMESGRIALYNQLSHQQRAVVEHDKPIDIIYVSHSAIITATTSAVTLYDMDGTLVWRNTIRIRCVDLIQIDNEIVAFTMHCRLVKWNAETGALLAEMIFPYQQQGMEPDEQAAIRKVPEKVALSASTCMAALSYRDGTLCLWDLKDGDFVGWAKEERDAHIAGLLFNPIPENQLLLAVYTTHAMSLFDTWTSKLVQSKPSAKDCLVIALCASPDGRTFATADNMGTLSIWDFQTLSHLSSISIPSAPFKLLEFSSDGASIFELTDESMRVWSPGALLGPDTSLNVSMNELGKQNPQVSTYSERRVTCITTRAASRNTDGAVIAGRNNGEVIAIKNSKICEKVFLHTHKHAITRLDISVDNLLASADDSGLVLLHKYEKATCKVTPLGQLGSLQVSNVVKQICFSADGEYLLISSTASHAVYQIADGSCVGVSEAEKLQDDINWRWFSEGSCGQKFWLVTGDRLEQFSAARFPEKLSSSTFNLRCGMSERYKPISVDAVLFEPLSSVLVVEVCYAVGLTLPTFVFLFSSDLSENSTADREYKPITTPQMSHHLAHFLGYGEMGGRFFFLTTDSWVASATVSEISGGSYTRHFYLPRNMLSATLLPVVVGDQVVVCQKYQAFRVSGGLRSGYHAKF